MSECNSETNSSFSEKSSNNEYVSPNKALFNKLSFEQIFKEFTTNTSPIIKYSYQPWVDKFRPEFFSDVLAQNNIHNILSYFYTNYYFPNLLFFGSSGIGKTSLAYICSSQLYKSNSTFMVLEINASEERGIDTIRNKIYNFCSTSSHTNLHKFIILDEADSMTLDAQYMLINLMDNFINNVRFCIICNNITKLIIEIRSRCLLLKFNQLSHSHIKHKINQIISTLNIPISNDCSKLLTKISNGDMRKVINILQLTFISYGIISINNIYSLTKYPSDKNINDIIAILISSSSIINKFNSLKLIIDNQLSFNDIIYEIIYNYLDYVVDIKSFIHELNKLQNNINICSQSSLHIYQLISIFTLYFTKF